jgi:hypothetical protein
VEAGSNTSTVTLRVVGGDENGSLESETVNMVASPMGLGAETDCAGEGQQHLSTTDPSSRQRELHQQTRNCLTVIKIWSLSPRWMLDTKRDRPTDRRS